MAAPARTQTNNPLERRPTPLPAEPDHKRGPGARYFPASRVGPSVQVPRISNSQSSRATALETGGPAINRSDGTSSREISRDGLTPDQRDNYGDIQ
jgi:hypothetical protein